MTDHRCARARPPFLQGRAGDLLGPVSVESIDGDSLDGRIELMALSGVNLLQMEGNAARVRLPDGLGQRPDRAMIAVNFQHAGTSFFDLQGYRVTLRPGDCLIYDMSRPFQLENPERTRIDMIAIPANMLLQRGVSLQGLPFHAEPDGAGIELVRDMVHGIIRRWQQLSGDPLRRDMLTDSLLNLFVFGVGHHIPASVARTAGARMLHQAKHYILKGLADPELNVAQVAEAVGCSARYLQKLFGQEGGSVSRYIWRQRLARCRQALAVERDARVTEIAFAWGFSSSAHFSRLFRQQYGISPSAARGMPLPLGAPGGGQEVLQ